MKYEHLIRVNDPSLPTVEFLSLEQIWFGLVAKAYRPQVFNTTLEGSEILGEQTSGEVTTIHRMLDFGAFTLSDLVELHPMSKTVNRVPATDFCGNSELVIQIEEPESSIYFLRFTYHVADVAETPRAGDYSMEQLNEARRQAYKAADIDAVKVIRAMARMNPPLEPGQQDRPLH